MARIWSSGFELNSLTAGVEVTSTTVAGGGAIAVSTTNVRSGTYALRSSNAGAGGRAIVNYNFVSADTSNKHFFRMYIYIVDLPDAISTIMNVETIAGTDRARIRLGTDGTLTLWDTVQVGSASSALSLNTWYMVEMMVYNNTGTGKMELDARLEGVSFASTTTSTATGTYGNVAFGHTSTVTSYDLYIDDIAINDTTGASQTSWAGSGKIIHLKPNASGDANAWLDTGGSAGTTNNYTLADEVTPDDATTMIQSGTLNNEDLYNCEASGIAATDTVNVVHVGGRFRNDTADATTAFKFEIEKTTGGTKSQSAAIVANSTTWKTNATASPWNYPITLYADPDAGAWTQSTLDTMQIGAILTTANVNKVQVSTVWALVDYTPGTISGATIKDFIRRGFIPVSR